MNINTATNYTAKINNVPYKKEQTDTPGSSESFLEPPKEIVDRTILSEHLRNQLPIGGLCIPYDPATPVAEKGVIKIGVVPPDLQQYLISKENAKNGHIDDYFFKLDFNSIKGQAQKLAGGEEYDPDNFEAYAFVKGIGEWFGEVDEASLAKSYEQIVRECADFIKVGSAIDIDQIKTTFSLRGEDVSIGKILEMSDVASKLSEINYGSGTGTSMYFSFAKRGLMKAAAEKYGETLPTELGKVFSENFKRLTDNNSKQSMQYWKQDSYYTGQSLKAFNNSIIQASEYGDKLFSGSDLSANDFSEKLNQFNKNISEFAQPGIEQASRRILTEAYNELLRIIA